MDVPNFRAISSVGEHYIDIVGVTGSIPVSPTILSIFTFPHRHSLQAIPLRHLTPLYNLIYRVILYYKIAR